MRVQAGGAVSNPLDQNRGNSRVPTTQRNLISLWRAIGLSVYDSQEGVRATLPGDSVIGDSDTLLREILSSTRTIAMVGASDKEHRPSFGVFRFLLAHGYDVVAVNPNCAGNKLHGKTVYRSLADVPGPIDMVDIFRNSKAACGAVREALALDPKPKAIWMQLGVRNEEAAARARAAGVKVVMDRCPAIEIRRLGIPPTGSNGR